MPLNSDKTKLIDLHYGSRDIVRQSPPLFRCSYRTTYSLANDLHKPEIKDSICSLYSIS